MQFRDSQRVTPLYEIPVLPPPLAVRVPAHPSMLLSLRLFFDARFCLQPREPRPNPKANALSRSNRLLLGQSTTSLGIALLVVTGYIPESNKNTSHFLA